MVVFAASGAEALAAADGNFGQDSNGIFAAIGTATAIVAGTDYAGYVLKIQAYDPVTPFTVAADIRANGIGANDAEIKSLKTPVINAGGTGYTVNDVLTLDEDVGGDANRQTTLRVTSVSTGVVDGIELVDPGDWVTLPALLTGISVTGGTGGNDATFDMTQTTSADLEQLAAHAVSLLNALVPIAGADIDFGDAGGPLLTVAAIADAIGDYKLIAELGKNGVDVPLLTGTVVDEGIAAAVLTVVLDNTAVIPNVLRVVDQV
jgi:hypothetical protein